MAASVALHCRRSNQEDLGLMDPQLPLHPRGQEAGQSMAFILGEAPHLPLSHALPAQQVQSGGPTHLPVLLPLIPLPTQTFPFSPAWPLQQAHARERHVLGSVLISVNAVKPGIAHLWTPSTLIHHPTLHIWRADTVNMSQRTVVYTLSKQEMVVLWHLRRGETNYKV